MKSSSASNTFGMPLFKQSTRDLSAQIAIIDPKFDVNPPLSFNPDSESTLESPLNLNVVNT